MIKIGNTEDLVIPDNPAHEPLSRLYNNGVINLVTKTEGCRNITALLILFRQKKHS